MEMDKLNEKINKLEKDLDEAREKTKKAEEKERKIADELKRCRNEKAALEMEEITASLGSNGLNLNDVLQAIKDGNLETLQTKIQEHKSESKKTK
ncbi:hypothetical protein [Clostridium sp. VAP23]|uniref:hypothetical protein n=1 Tax=Clostridium sp. VAP23 TaxID=2949981 RepID=UPI00207959F6|nr:hypothetical protein [Clostridium sp. VAP23]